jgi:RNA polymerase sigma-70 factor (ECF subfamily)
MMAHPMVEPQNTRDLIERAQNGEREAFDELARAYQDRLRASIESWARFRLGPRLDVEDLLQETFLRAYGSVQRFVAQDDDSFLRWLCGIAKRALAQASLDARRAERDAVSREPSPSAPSPSTALRREERFDRLEAALAKLSRDQHEAIRLCRFEGLTSADAGVRMGRSPEAVRQLLVRALRELKATFGDTESFHLPDRRMRTDEVDRDE